MPSDPVVLPVPPSVNALWRVARTRAGKASVVIQDKYAAWMDEAILRLKMQMPVAKRYPVAVRVAVVRGEGWTKGRDLDNCLKAILDALKKARRVTDDSEEYVAEVSIGFGPKGDKACVLVTVEPLGVRA